jgi:hypothetical protein
MVRCTIRQGVLSMRAGHQLPRSLSVPSDPGISSKLSQLLDPTEALRSEDRIVITVPRPHGPTAPQPHGPMEQWPQGPAAPRPHGPTAPRPHGPTALWPHGPTAPWPYGPMAPWPMLPWPHGPMTPWPMASWHYSSKFCEVVCFCVRF